MESKLGKQKKVRKLFNNESGRILEYQFDYPCLKGNKI